MTEKIWDSYLTADMVEGWDRDRVEELIQELDDAIERIYSDFELGVE